ncbi:hypothetical protein ANN_00600 [Periplaneta americana]|uniref:Uncharacterized protein n=1 Tax=Periplaneta americana TaxID=6978 RepID=A0ABQ8TR80_PERAM|nr:hypothetical protein ANN_00600 [Periplaneta americana]
MASLCEDAMNPGFLKSHLSKGLTPPDTAIAFNEKLLLWIRQMQKGEIYHFPFLSKRCDVVYAVGNFIVYGGCTVYFIFLERTLTFSSADWRNDTHRRPRLRDRANVQSRELIDLRCDREMRAKYDSRSSLMQFYDGFPTGRFPNLHKLCEKVFSSVRVVSSETGCGARDVQSERELAYVCGSTGAHNEL